MSDDVKESLFFDDQKLSFLKDHLFHWFRLEEINTADAFALLIGVYPAEKNYRLLRKYGREKEEHELSDEDMLSHGLMMLNYDWIMYWRWENDEARLVEVSRVMHDLSFRYRKLSDYWRSGKRTLDERYPLVFFVEWAKSRGLAPDWLSLAEELELITSDKGVADNNGIDAIQDDKPLTTRERNTLLTIIAALAKEAKIDLTKPSKAAALIAFITQDMNAPVDHATIENKIRLIPDALESRSK